MQLKSIFESGIKGHLVALFSGALLALCFAPHSLFPLPFLSLTLFLSSLIYVKKRTGFLRGYLFGLGLFGIGVSWVYVSIHTYGHQPPYIAAGLTALFVMLLALAPAFTGYTFTRFFPANCASKFLGAFPALWFFFEWVKSWIFTGFPWLDVGYTQLNSPLRDYAPFVGSYGLSFIVALCAGIIVYGILSSGATRKKCILGFIFIWALAPILGLIHLAKPEGSPVSVTIVQANIPPLLKWNPAQVEKTMAYYKTTTEQHWDSQLIVWPESAIPVLRTQAMPYLIRLAEEAKKHNTSIILGIPTETLANGDIYNSLIVIGNGRGEYRKRHLVPFGEFTPQKDIAEPVMKFLDIPMADLKAGSYIQSQPYANGIRLSPLICYESAFADLVRTFIAKAQLIVTVSDDLWFGHSWAVAQHLQMTQMRALEMSRYAIFANNNGSSSIINANGKIEQRAPDDEAATITGDIIAYNGYTVWTWLGLNLHVLVFIFLLIQGLRRQYNIKHKGAPAI